MKEVVITLNEAFNQANCCECATVTITGADGKKRTRVVSVESVIMALRNSTVMQKVNVAVGKIPCGYYDAQVSEEQGKFSADMVAVLPAGKQMMQYEETLYDVSIPSLVFQFSVAREKITETKVYAMKDEVPTDKSRLYRYPFGNVSQGGYVCWGGNNLPNIRSLKGLEEAMMLFIQSPCNSDYFRGKEYCGHAEISLREFFEKLKDEDVYPEDYLVALKQGRRNMTLGDLVSWRGKNNKRRIS